MTCCIFIKQKTFCWTVPDALMRKITLHQAGKHITNVLKPYFVSRQQPYFVKDAIWKTMLENKAKPEAVHRSDVNRANRGSKRSVENGNYHGGSRKVIKWMKVMVSLFRSLSPLYFLFFQPLTNSIIPCSLIRRRKVESSP